MAELFEPNKNGDDALRVNDRSLAAMRAALPRVAEGVVAAVIAEVPSYSEPFRGRMGRIIENAVALALSGFLESLAGTAPGADQLQRVFAAAFQLGQGEARSGRSMDALAAAYRIGTHRAWDDLSAIAVETGLPSAEVARFAGLVFDYLDQLSAVSVAGHAAQLADDDRLHERQRATLALALVTGQPETELREAAERANWLVPEVLTVVVLPRSSAAVARSQLDERTLQLDADLAALVEWPQHVVLLVPGDGAGRSGRAALLAAIGQQDAVIGPERPWTDVRSSLERAIRVLELGIGQDAGHDGTAIDSDDYLAELVLGADEVARTDLRARVLEPLSGLRPGAAEKLTETLRTWLFHQGRRDDIAAALFVHPQTVRYRLSQLRELYGDRLEDPAFVRDASIALA
jgi:hypothetical protein